MRCVRNSHFTSENDISHNVWLYAVSIPKTEDARKKKRKVGSKLNSVEQKEGEKEIYNKSRITTEWNNRIFP